MLDFLLKEFKAPELAELKKISKKVAEAVEMIYSEGQQEGHEHVQLRDSMTNTSSFFTTWGIGCPRGIYFPYCSFDSPSRAAVCGDEGLRMSGVHVLEESLFCHGPYRKHPRALATRNVVSRVETIRESFAGIREETAAAAGPAGAPGQILGIVFRIQLLFAQ
ncbi:MAG: hypothetical protein WDN09_02705 [bacterium]